MCNLFEHGKEPGNPFGLFTTQVERKTTFVRCFEGESPDHD